MMPGHASTQRAVAALVVVSLIGGLTARGAPARAAGVARRHYSEHIAYKNHWSFERWLEWRLARIQEYRNRATHAIWVDDPGARWSPRDPEQCRAELARRGVAAAPMAWTATPVPTPVEVLAPIAGVEFARTREDAPLYMSCELATRLPALARVFARHGVRRVQVMSAYRVFVQGSFHSVGLALDISGFETDQGAISLLEHFARTPTRPTCPPPRHADSAAQLLADVTCELFETHALSTVVTPNYNKGHWDHYHLDIRPHDARRFVR